MNPARPGLDWYELGRILASRLLSSGVSAYQLADLRYRHGVLSRQLGAPLAALGPRPGDEGRVPGQWVTHVDGRELFLTPARAAAENAFNLGWDHVVEPVIRERTRNQTLPGSEPENAPGGAPRFLVTLGLDPGCTADDVKRAYRTLAMAAHPDTGGDHDLFITLGRARDEALAWVGARSQKTTDGFDGKTRR